MKLGQLMENNVRNNFIQKSYKKWGSKTSSGPLFAFGKSFIQDESMWSAPQSRDMLNLIFYKRVWD